MSRTIWRGAISFGLVHVPIVVHPGARAARLNFDWIDKRDHAPVGYQRINKNTGKVIDSEDIVKGYEYEKGEYVFMSDADFDNANIAATQTIELLDFVAAEEVPLYYFDTPYYLAPDKRGNKGYALLRDALKQSDRIGLANVVLHTKQHLAAVMAMGEVLVMMTMRYANEILPIEELEVPEEGGKGKDAPTKAEIDMAMKLVESMTRAFEPERYVDTYREDLLAAIDKKVKAGKTHELTDTREEAPERESAQVIDLMAVLRRSIEGKGRKSDGATDSPPSSRPASATASKGRARSGGHSSSAAGGSRAASKSSAKKPTKTAAKTASTRAKPAVKSAGKRTSGAAAKTTSKTAAKRPQSGRQTDKKAA